MDKLLKSILIFLSLFLVSGCGMMANDYGDIEEDQSFYLPGATVPAVGYDEARQITLYLKTGEGENSFKKIANGDYVEKGPHAIGIEVIPGLDGQIPENQRVFVGDGGWNYQVEAFLNETSGYYECEYYFFDSSIYLTQPVLIQVIYPDKTASKEKYVVTTFEGLRAESGKLVGKGMGISLSDTILENLKGGFSSMFPPETADLLGEVLEFMPASGDGDGIFHFTTTNMSFDMALTDSSEDETGETIRGLNIVLENFTGGEPSLDFNELLMSFFFTLFGGLIPKMEIPAPAVAFPLASLLAGDTSSPESDGESDPMADLLKNLQMDTTLFLNIYGLPKENIPDKFAVLGGGLYAADSNLVPPDSEGNITWPDVDVDPMDTGMDLDRIKIDGKDIGIALSQYNMNQMLSDMMRSFAIVLENMQDMGLPGFEPKDANNSLDIAMTINPGGIAINMKPQEGKRSTEGVFALNDMRLEFLEAGEPTAELSMDLNMNVSVSLSENNGAYELLFALEPDFDYSYMHVMKDTMGLGMFDHGRFVKLMFDFITGNESSALSLPIPIPMITSKDDNGEMTFDQDGNCFMNLAVEGLETEGICFISTASF
ncbi:MAG: hypothetical protein GY864_02585 [Desulfobacterales bacterium]|nr:hypothetical protein [Desulfobacterales bacterium]